MKVKISILIITTFVFGLVYFIADSKLFYYGESTHNILGKSLPLELQLDFLDSRVSYPIIGFVIKDQYGVIQIGRKVSINIDTTTVKIKEVIKYGFNENFLVANVLTEEDRVCNIKLISYPNSRLVYRLLPSEESDVIGNLNWIVLKDGTIIKSLRSNTILLYIVIVILFFTGSFIIKKIKY